MLESHSESNPFNDLSLEDYVKLVDDLINKGWTVYTKFTCLHCGSRQTGEEPNTVCTGGYSCEECGEVSHPDRFGCAILRVIEN